jgi:hypothetical protein
VQAGLATVNLLAPSKCLAFRLEGFESHGNANDIFASTQLIKTFKKCSSLTYLGAVLGDSKKAFEDKESEFRATTKAVQELAKHSAQAAWTFC